MILQIYVYGPKYNGYLDLAPGTAMEMENASTLFDEELSVSEFSVPFEVPWTDNNRRLLGFAERVDNFNRPSNWFKCDVLDNGVPKYTSAKFTILEKIGKFNYTSGSFNATISGTKGLLGAVIKDQKLSGLKLDGIITYATPTRVFAQELMEGLFPQYWYLKFVPVAFEDFFDTNRPDYDNEFLAKDTVNYTITSFAAWNFGRPRSDNPAIAADEGNIEYRDYRSIPFFNLKYVYRKAFEENGFTIKGAFVDENIFDELFIFNNYSLEKYTDANIDVNREIDPANHLPDMELAVFIDAVNKLFKLKMDFTGANEITLSYKKNTLTQRTPIDVTAFCTADFKSTLPGTEETKGYNVAYEWDSEDQFVSDRVKDLSELTFVATVLTKGDLAGIIIGRPLTIFDYAYVVSENMFYRVADATDPFNVKWDCYAENLGPYTVAEGERTVSLPLSTLCQYAEFNSITALWEKRNYLGCRQRGSYINNAGNRVKAPFALRVFFAGFKNIDGYSLPVSFNHNRIYNGAKDRAFSLSIKENEGIATTFHKTFEDFNQNKEVVETQLLHNRSLDTILEQTNCVTIKGVQFMVYKTETRMPADMTMKAFLVPL